jgi:hypothetical protein
VSLCEFRQLTNRYWDLAGKPFLGALDEVGIYPRARTGLEIAKDALLRF